MWYKLRENLIEQKLKESDGSKALNIFFYSFIFIFLCIFLLQQFVFSSVIVSGTSMNDTLQSGDMLVVNRLQKPKNGDIIVFYAGTIDEFGNIEYKYDYNNQPIFYIKRVIASGGEKIYWKDGVVSREYFDGETTVKISLDEPYVKGKTYSSMFGGDNIAGISVPNGHYFVMGDNRLVSNDSRGSIGMVDERLILGVVPDFVVSKKDTFLSFFYKIF